MVYVIYVFDEVVAAQAGRPNRRRGELVSGPNSAPSGRTTAELRALGLDEKTSTVLASPDTPGFIWDTAALEFTPAAPRPKPPVDPDMITIRAAFANNPDPQTWSTAERLAFDRVLAKRVAAR